MSKIKIGWSEKELSFDKPVSLSGQFAERISQYVEKPLTVTAFAVESDEDSMILCAFDLASTSYALLKEIRKSVAAANKEIDVDKIVISAIHTHTGPGYKYCGQTRISNMYQSSSRAVQGSRALLEAELPEGKKYVEKVNVSGNKNIMNGDELLEIIVREATAAIVEAWETRKAGSFSNAFGRAAVGMCRRASYSDGTAQMWGDANRAVFTHLEGGNDSGIELLYVFDDNNNLTGVVANLACPAQCVQHRLFISPDFWGEVKMLLRKHFGENIFLLPLCSAAGDQCPVDLVRWVEPESDLNDPNIKRNNPPKRKADPSMFDIAGMKKAGKRIANEIIEVYNEGLDEAQSDIELVHRVEEVKLPLRRATLAEEIAAKKAIREYLQNKPGDVDYNDAANLQIHLGVLRRMEVQEDFNVIPLEIHIIKLGSIAIATNPFELFLDYGNQIKARSNAEQTFLIQLANGCEGYLPTEKAEKGGHYSAFIASGCVGHEGGDLLVRETLKNINELFER